MDLQTAQQNPNVPGQAAGSAAATTILDDVGYLEKTLAEKQNLPEELKAEAQRIIARVRRVTEATGFSQEYELARKYIEWITRIPWGQYSQDNYDLNHAKKVMDETHHGLQKVKDRVLEYLAVMRIKGEKTKQMTRAPIMCFVGLQGIGKTTMAKGIANALGRKFIRISLGAMGSITELRGIPKSETDAEPGQIIKALVNAKAMNPVILLDELDKVSGQKGKRTDVMSALLEILDPEQNPTFRDHYIDHPVDLSYVLFICTANNLGTITTALQDRLETIRFYSYSDAEKQVIGQKHLLPKVLEKSGLSSEQLEFSEGVWPTIIRPLGYDAGVRQLERNIESISRKAALEIVSGKSQKITITPENVKNYIQESGAI